MILHLSHIFFVEGWTFTLLSLRLPATRVVVGDAGAPSLTSGPDGPAPGGARDRSHLVGACNGSLPAP